MHGFAIGRVILHQRGPSILYYPDCVRIGVVTVNGISNNLRGSKW